jgi:rRNA maturation endonuclease Nob1
MILRQPLNGDVYANQYGSWYKGYCERCHRAKDVTRQHDFGEICHDCGGKLTPRSAGYVTTSRRIAT